MKGQEEPVVKEEEKITPEMEKIEGQQQKRRCTIKPQPLRLHELVKIRKAHVSVRPWTSYTKLDKMSPVAFRCQWRQHQFFNEEDFG